MGKGGKLNVFYLLLKHCPKLCCSAPCTVPYPAALMLGKGEDPWEKNAKVSDRLGAVSNPLWVF